MKKKNYLCYISLGISLLMLSFNSCTNDDENGDDNGNKNLSEEYYTGGQLGTVFDDGIFAYKQPTTVVESSPEMLLQFKYGEAFFDKKFNTSTSGVRSGLGPVFVRSSCVTCHPGYGHGMRKTEYNADEHGNGYLLVVFDKDTEAFVPQLTGMPQTRAVSPYLPPVDERGIKLEWKNYVDEFGNQFPDGETYSLIYPEITIDPEYINTDPKPSNFAVRLEATIGIYGTGLLDAIPDDSIIAEYNKKKAKGYTLNDKMYDPANYPQDNDGERRHPGRFTYGLTRSTLQNGPGSNAIWNITNVTRPGRQYNYITEAYARAMSKNTNVQTTLGKSETEIFNELMSKSLPVELSEQEYTEFMVWHRGLAVPAARNLDDPEVKQGRAKFQEIGCTSCHKPSWTTGDDNYGGDDKMKNKLPRYPHQKIWPYTDMLQHRLEMINNIRTGWCRTTPLWARGLSEKCTGAGDHLHDMRARNYQEAIMWHGSAKSDARRSVEKYRNLSKSDRDAIIKFLEAI